MKKRLFFSLIALLAIALGLRITNLTFGYPVLYVIPDEVANYQSALTMLATKSPFSFSHYPPLGSYVQIPFFIAVYAGSRILQLTPTFEAFQLFLLTHEGALLFVPRLISALLGVASVYIGFRLTQELFPQKKYVAFLTLILLAFSTTHIQLSTIGKPIIPAVFFSWLCIYYLYKSTQEKTPFRSLLYAILALSISVSFYFSMLLYALLYIWVILFNPRFKQKVRQLSLLIIPLAAFYISLKLNAGGYIPHHSDAWQKFQANMTEGLGQIVFAYIKNMVLTEPVLTFGFFGGLFLYKRFPPFLRQLVWFSLFHLVFFMLFYWNSVRYVLPVFLPMTLVAVSAFQKRGRLALIGIVVLAILPGLTWYTRYSETPTFIQSQNWIEKNVGSSQTVVFEGNRFVGFVPAYNSIKLLQGKNPGAYQRLSSVLKSNEYPPNVRELVFLEKEVDLTDATAIAEFLKTHPVNYIVGQCQNPNWKALKSTELVAQFSPFTTSNTTEADLIHHTAKVPEILRVNRFGTCIDIWKVAN